LRWYELAILLVLLCLILVVAVLLLRKHEAAISIRRDRLQAVREHFSEQFDRAWSVQGKRDEFVSVLEILEAAVVAGGGVAFWLLWVRFGA
jgi:CBS domain containing-hemolysin-like protein